MKKKECASVSINNISSAGNYWGPSDFVNQSLSKTNEYDKKPVNSTRSAYSGKFFDLLMGRC
jgi:hypothetical protein